MDIIWTILKQALTITGFVMTMMLIIDYINVISKGKVLTKLQSKRGLQILTGTLLGLIPGCLGTFTAVSMYTHRLLSFGALTATMIATSGDETFLMFAMLPGKVWIIILVLAVVAIISGFVTDKIMGKRDFISKKGFSFDIHDNENTECIRDNIKFFNFKFSGLRIITLLVLAFFIVAPLAGLTHHEHIEFIPNSKTQTHETTQEHEHHSHEHASDEATIENEDNHNHEGLDWVSISLLISASLGFLICLTCSDHFLKDHLVKHLIVKHLPKIFLWTLIALMFIHLFLKFTDFQVWINHNLWIVLLIAVLVGFIPESGPHLLFLTMFISGTIPLSILIANSIVQDGHGALPLFAESKRSFFAVKTINLFIGLIIGGIGLFFGL